MSLDATAVLELFRELLAELGNEDQAKALTVDMQVKDLGMDSLELLEFLMLVEERAGVEIAVEEATLDTHVSKLVALVVDS